jgi:hypothetical protein
MKERRFAPRYSCDFTVAVEVEKQRHEFAVRNISALGLAVEFSQLLKQILAGLGMRLDVGDHLNLLLPAVDGKPPSVPVRCQVQYLRRLSQDSWLMGCQFVKPDSGIDQLVGDRIRTCSCK